ncbi:beta-galactosidase-1-like protein 2 isoform X1 [Bacillus rossius redtenbacheri]|uniref:beta-galactosidase-1-like protein 2 isoform X1 n=1 Tax=Bacillus rossius redtenbacheri TaxID=93214 RepID=UPI002FDEB47A
MFRVVNFILAVIFCQWSPVNGFKATLPTLYEHYTQGGISSGLTTYPEGFLLNGKNITIVSGAIHYFRVHPEYWRARLRQLRAAGFVAVETYIPWNLHEPRSGEYDFGEGDNDFSLFLDFVKYLKVAQEEDLLAIVRPGPWIAAEWENGGLPSWLLRDPNLRPRHSNRPFIYYMNRFYDKVFPILRRLQFTEGGPIIAFQIENEYGLVGKGGSHPDTAYLQEIYQEMVKHNLTALKFTMDAPFNSYKNGSLPGVLMTANFQTDPVGQLKELKKLQPDQPLWVIESYPGWFDSWFDSQHYTMSTQASIDMTRAILEMSSSINLYMFHGGTTFGFMNGAIPNAHTPTIKFHVNSYDYDAPVTEAGDYTQKYNATAELVKQFLAVDTKLPQRPPESVKQAYGTVSYTGQLTVSQLIDQVPRADRVRAENVVAMELLDINSGSGQSYGFVVYRRKGVEVPSSSVLQITGYVHDMAVVLVDGVRETQAVTSLRQVSEFGCWQLGNGSLTLDAASSGTNKTLDILVENMGRRLSKKGLYDGDVLLNRQAIRDWEIVALQFHTKWVKSLTGWQKVSKTTGPTLFRSVLDVSTPHDTFVDMSAWGKGNVFVNGFNIGRYFSVGPTHTLYVPAPLLRKGANEILVFELYSPGPHLTFTDQPKLSN